MDFSDLGSVMAGFLGTPQFFLSHRLGWREVGGLGSSRMCYGLLSGDSSVFSQSQVRMARGRWTSQPQEVLWLALWGLLSLLTVLG